MEIILWRHAEAQDGQRDLYRPLTRKGQQQAKISAAWLKEHLPPDTRVLVSQALRSQQTAAYLKRPAAIMPTLNPDTHISSVMNLLQSQTDQTPLVWVGHQPWIGQLCSYLLNGSWLPQQYWSVKKAAFWWFSFEFIHGRPQARLKVMLSPAMLK
ncbi:histidine phosphatase family protein [Neisseriaceae bacterium ESL0693]|nr:histidine phosphatase family protein [Neisseriaceae bacterium ESL0693]